MSRVFCTRLCNMSLMFLFLSTTYMQSNALQVIGEDRTVVQGATVTLPCRLVDATEPLSQISWQRTTRVKHKNGFLTVLEKNGPRYVNGKDDRFKFIGNFNELDGSIQISNVSLLDDGNYTCIYTLFPSGSYNTDIHLNVLVPPVIRVKDNLPTLADKEVCIATCTAAGSKPPAEVRWDIGSFPEQWRETNHYTDHINGTTTTVSSLFGVPTMAINQKVVPCVVSSPALSGETRIPFTVQVYLAPMELKIVEPTQQSFQCMAEAIPEAEFSWTRVDQAWPQSGVRVEGATLKFLTRSSDLNGLYQCNAHNLLGRSSVYISISREHCTACWILFSLLFVILIILLIAAAWFLYKSKKLPCLSSSEPHVTREAMEEEVMSPL